MRVLVVEDERLLADTITAGLRKHAMAVDVAYDGDQALERLAVNDYDVIVLDRDLPVVSGEQLLERAWDEHVDSFTGVVRFTVMMLRRKLGQPSVIQTVPGAGYRIP